MKSWILLLVSVLATAALSPASLGGAELRGQVFIVTPEGTSLKLGLVTVSVLPNEETRAAVRATDAELASQRPGVLAMAQALTEAATRAEVYLSALDLNDPARLKAMALHQRADHWAELSRGAVAYVGSAFAYFQNLPAAVRVAKTDADGRFSLEVKAGDYVLAARAQRLGGKGPEHYDWLVPVRVDASGARETFLSNDNTSTAGATNDSLIHTVVGAEELAPTGRSSLAQLKEKRAEEERQEQARVAEDLRVRENEAQARAAALKPKPTPGPVATPPANLEAQVAASQRRAVAKYPDLGKTASPMQLRYRVLYEAWKARKDGRLSRPDWPELLAEEVAAGR